MAIIVNDEKLSSKDQSQVCCSVNPLMTRQLHRWIRQDAFREALITVESDAVTFAAIRSFSLAGEA